MPANGQVNRFTREPYALQCAFLDRARLPARAGGNIKMAVLRIECSAIRTRKKSSRQGHDGALRNSIHDISQHERQAAPTPEQVQHLTGQRPPLSWWHPDLAAAGVINAVWNPAQRRVIAQRTLQCDLRSPITVVAARFNFTEYRR